ncbi:MAG: caspase family protein, partial [Alistipes sp.]
FYYAGHGIPDVETEAAYLLPTDGYGSNVISGYKLSDLYKSLSSYPTQAAIVFLDACFSGAQRSGEMLASARGVAIKVKEDAPAGNMVVFAATQGDQTAYPYRDKGHGLFTYYLLQKLQQTKGNTTLGELATFLTTNVREKSIVTNRKSQIPSITPSAAIAEDWKTLRLK